MDETDQRLIDLLRADARAPTAALARALGLSRTTVQSRMERLERSGVVAGYTVKVSEGHERGLIQAYVMMTVSHRRANEVAAAARKMAAIRRLQAVSGPFDLVAVVAARSVSEMDAAIDALGDIPGVERTTTSIVLASKIER